MQAFLPPRQITLPVLPLYVAFGASAGLLQVTVPSILQRQGLGVEATGMLALLYLPFGLSALWAPLVDRLQLSFMDRRRTWILLCQAVVVSALVFVAFAGTSELGPLVAALALLSLASATMDVSLDGFIAETSEDDDRLARGILKVGGMLLGALLGSLLVLFMMDRIGWTLSILTLATLSTLATLPFMLGASVINIPKQRRMPSFGRFLTAPGILPRLLLVAIIGLAMGAGINATRLLIVERGVSLTSVGAIYGPVSLIAGLAGASLAAAFGRRHPTTRVLLGAGMLFCIAMLLFDGAVATAANLELTAGSFVAISNAAYTVVYACICAVTMRWIDRTQAATDYSVAQSGWNLALVVGTALGGVALASMQLATFPVAGILVVAAAWLLVRLEQRIPDNFRAEGIDTA